MGRVFTLDEFKAGQIPRIDDYRKAMSDLVGGLNGLYAQGVIFGANVHGSIFHPDLDVGSDIDVLIVVNDDTGLYEVGRLVQGIGKRLYVPVEAVPVRRKMAENGNHNLDNPYLDYMERYCKEGVVGQNPLPIVKRLHTSPFEDGKNRLVVNLSKLSKMAAAPPKLYGEKHCNHLEKATRHPIYSAIDLLRLRLGMYPARNDGTPVSKGEACQMYFDEFDDMITGTTRDDLKIVLNMRNTYRRFLRENRTGSPEAYADLLDDIDMIVPHAMRVIEENIGIIDRMRTS